MNEKTEAPRLISWNITLRCPLKCDHCYTNAGENEVEGVLSTKEAYQVIDQICETGNPILILSGGEPLLRNDIFDIARYGTEKGLRMAMGTSGYPLDRDVAERLRSCGVKAVAVSLDSADPDIHDAFRGVSGVWERAVSAIHYCKSENLHVQINMSVLHPDIQEIERVIELGTSLGVYDYQMFFPVHTGRGRELSVQDPVQYENFIRQLLVTFHGRDIRFRPTCAPQFRRIASQAGLPNPGWGRGCIAGLSYCRIYANGDVTPCPYLPVSAGNLRDKTFSDIWNNSPVFTVLRDAANFSGKCSRCTFFQVCGGCRARAYRGTDAFSAIWCDGLNPPQDVRGDLCGEDPFCPYQPEVDP